MTTNVAVYDATNIAVCNAGNGAVYDATNVAVCDATNVAVYDATNVAVCNATNVVGDDDCSLRIFQTHDNQENHDVVKKSRTSRNS